VLFNIYARLVSLDQKAGPEVVSTELRSEVSKEAQLEEIRAYREPDLISRPGGVLGLSS